LAGHGHRHCLRDRRACAQRVGRCLSGSNLLASPDGDGANFRFDCQPACGLCLPDQLNRFAGTNRRGLRLETENPRLDGGAALDRLALPNRE
jgi:hypothetical protein